MDMEQEQPISFAERQADTGLLADIPPPGTLSLASPEVVGELLRDFMAQMADARIGQWRGTVDEPTAQALFKTLATRISEIYRGQDREYFCPRFITSCDLDKHLTTTPGLLPEGTSYSQAVYLLLAELLNELASFTDAALGGSLSRDNWKTLVDGLAEDYTNHLLGIPVDGPEEYEE